MRFEVGPWTLNGLETLALTLGMSGLFFLLGTALLFLRKRMITALVGGGLAGFGFGGAGLVMWMLAGMQGPLLEAELPEPLDLTGARRGVRSVPAGACFIGLPDGAGVCDDPLRTVHHVPGDAPAEILRPGMQLAVPAEAPRMFGIVPIVAPPADGPVQRVHPNARGGVLYGQAPLSREALHAALEALPHSVAIDVHPAPPTTVADVIATCLSARPRPCGVREPPPPRVPHPIKVLKLPEAREVLGPRPAAPVPPQ